jgi:hypothetical protein|tara:strand:+ start:17793 stop:18026 length:234 start_codon:yes stop_codon:yes gene_type:complete
MTASLLRDLANAHHRKDLADCERLFQLLAYRVGMDEAQNYYREIKFKADANDPGVCLGDIVTGRVEEPITQPEKDAL